MTYLLDTHSFLWAAFEPERFSRRVRELLKNPLTEVHVSSISFWEISLKFALGKLALKNLSPEELPGAARQMGFELITLDPETAASFHQLGCASHKDPFDRMLIWQAVRRQMTLISKDKRFSDYAPLGLMTLW